ncbi:MAG: hypothetical protein K2H43_05465 [Clostridia bacterium]|nr:hypothetical protein [Clostridia bacterium]
MNHFFTSYLATLLMFMPISTSVIKTEAISTHEMRNHLIYAGIDEIYLEMITEEELISLYNDFKNDLIVVGETQTISLTETNANNIQPLGAISSDNMLFTVGHIYHLVDASSIRIKDALITITFNWKKVPKVLREDAVAVNWDSDVFTYQSDSFSSYCKASHTFNGKTFSCKSTLSAPTQLYQSSLGYIIDLQKATEIYYQSSPQNIKGVATFGLLPKIANTYSSTGRVTSINAQYCHNYDVFHNLSFSFSGVSITINTGNKADFTTASCNCYYQYYNE